MNERQLTVCAAALWADGWSTRQIAEALQVTTERAQELTGAGADAQAAGDIGFMKAGHAPNSRDV